MVFIPDGDSVRVRDVQIVTRQDEIRAYVAYRTSRIDTALEDNVRTLYPRDTYAAWSRCMAHGAYERPLTMPQWRDARTADAVATMLRMTCDNARGTAGVARESKLLSLADGTVVYVRTSDERDERNTRLRHVIAARRLARRYRRAMLRSSYAGTLTADGMSVGMQRTNVQPLQSAIALSDTYVTRHGEYHAVLYARDVQRDDSQGVDIAATMLYRRTKQANRGREVT